jgi:uncharacterized SAM-binding protein YcdF (DUF218 family)
MFFLLSKILGFLFSPFIWVCGLCLFAILTKKPKRRKKLLISAVVAFFIFSNGFIYNEAIRLWEEKPGNIEKFYKTYDYGIVLGGMLSYDDEYQIVNFNGATNRLTATILLYKAGKIKKIIISGGSGSIAEPEHRESVYIRDFLQKIGIPAEDILIEENSRNTRENAVNTYKLIKSQTLQGQCLLITSAMHVKRAKACFQKAGFNLEVFAAGRMGSKRTFWPDRLLIPDLAVFSAWRELFHELFGYWVYKFLGYL